MSDTLGSLMEKNLSDVFGQRDSTRRAAAIAELYTADCTFFEALNDLCIGVRDTGPGLGPQALSRLFEPCRLRW
jgi:signal transduction histidine kinase